ncbi:MAG: sulfite reductase, partial [Chlamydiia bacterium]|nr:sulfite reductase [Chlamydiia bacterium]
MTEFTKENPFPAKIRERYPLNREGSSKKTYHLSLDLSGAGMEYKVGDAVGIFPENRAEDVEALLEALDCSGNESVVDPRSGAELSFETYLKTGANLLRVPTPLLKLKGDPSLLGEENKEARSQYIAQRDLISFFEETKNPLPLQELISYFAPMLPRFYSIASSQKI